MSTVEFAHGKGQGCPQKTYEGLCYFGHDCILYTIALLLIIDHHFYWHCFIHQRSYFDYLTAEASLLSWQKCRSIK